MSKIVQIPRMFSKEETIAPVRPMIPVGACMDIPTAEFAKGIHGEMILSGGSSGFDGIVAGPNRFKTTIMHHRVITAAYRMGPHTTVDTFDTEANAVVGRFIKISQTIDPYSQDWITSGRWMVTGQTDMSGEEWFERVKTHIQDKDKNRKAYSIETNFEDIIEAANGKPGVPIKIVYPTFAGIDSISDFEDDSTVKMREDNSISDSGGNMLYMTANRGKTRIVSELSKASGSVNLRVCIVGQYDKKINMGIMPEQKQLQFDKNEYHMRGAPKNFRYLTEVLWLVDNTSLLKNGSDGSALYPISPDRIIPDDKDLNIATLYPLRNKHGKSGSKIQVIISQDEGVLPSLTEFHYIKTNKFFGLEGNDRSYHSVLLPDIALSRTKVRMLLDQNYALRRAINITSECLQMRTFMMAKIPFRYFLSMEKLKEMITERGYEWSTILNYTRGWWTIDETNPYLELSTFDLLRMAYGEYHPYWLDKDNKTILKQYDRRKECDELNNRNPADYK